MMERFLNWILGLWAGPPTHWVLLVRGTSDNVWLVEHTSYAEAATEKAALEAKGCYVEVHPRTNSIRGEQRLLPVDADPSANEPSADEVE